MVFLFGLCWLVRSLGVVGKDMGVKGVKCVKWECFYGERFIVCINC